MKFEVTKQLRVVYTVEADDPQQALAAEPPGDATVSILKERAKDLDKQPSAGRPALVDRELRPGRRFVAKYKKQEWTAEVLADGQIALRKKGGSHAETFPTLAKAATHIIDGKAVNAWALFRDAPAAKEKLAAGPPKPEAPTIAEEPTEAESEPVAEPKGKGAKKS